MMCAQALARFRADFPPGIWLCIYLPFSSSLSETLQIIVLSSFPLIFYLCLRPKTVLWISKALLSLHRTLEGMNRACSAHIVHVPWTQMEWVPRFCSYWLFVWMRSIAGVAKSKMPWVNDRFLLGISGAGSIIALPPSFYLAICFSEKQLLAWFFLLMSHCLSVQVRSSFTWIPTPHSLQWSPVTVAVSPMKASTASTLPAEWASLSSTPPLQWCVPAACFLPSSQIAGPCFTGAWLRW